MAAARLFLLVLSLSLFVIPSLSLSNAEALLQFKKSLNITMGDLNSWKVGTNPCSGKWWGIYCSRGKTVSGIHVTRLGLSGTVDVQALSTLKGLRTIRLDNNMLSGTMPPFNQLVNVRSLLLSNNSFSGDIPDDFFEPMVNLKRLFLDNNDFMGKIPSSIMRLPLLGELNLQGNSFLGTIPGLKEGSPMNKLDLSNNDLKGEIPPSLAKFDATSFQGNPQLCGQPLNVQCPKAIKPESSGKAAITSIAMLVLFFLLVAIIAARRRRQNQFRVLDKDHLSDNNVVEVQVPEHTKQLPVGSTRKREGDHSTRKGSHHGKGGSIGDLIMVNDEKGAFGLPDLMKAAAEVLGNGSLGSAYKAVMANGLAVVVKRIRDMNKLAKDAFDVEMKRLGTLRHRNVLTPFAYHYRREEKLIVSEYMPKSSLLYVLHGDRGIYHSELTWPTRLKIIQGVAKGMDFLHKEFASYKLPHGNLKSSNVLLNENYEPVLSDYAFLPLLQQDSATQALFAYKTPEFTRTQQISPKSDVYCLGIVIVEIITGKFPSQYLSNGKGGTDIVQWLHSSVAEHNEEELIDPEIASNTDSVGQMVELFRIGAACIASNPEERLDMREAVRRIEKVQT